MRCGLSEHNLYARTNWKNQEDPVLCCQSSTCENLWITLPQKAQAWKFSQKEQIICLSCREPKRRKIIGKRKKRRTSMYTNFWWKQSGSKPSFFRLPPHFCLRLRKRKQTVIFAQGNKKFLLDSTAKINITLHIIWCVWADLLDTHTAHALGFQAERLVQSLVHVPHLPFAMTMALDLKVAISCCHLFTAFLSSLELVFSLFPLWKQTQVRFAALSFCRNQGFSFACYNSPVLLGWRRQGAGFRCTLVNWSFVLSRP